MKKFYVFAIFMITASCSSIISRFTYEDEARSFASRFFNCSYFDVILIPISTTYGSIKYYASYGSKRINFECDSEDRYNVCKQVDRDLD